MPKGAFHQGLRAGAAVFAQQVFFHGAGIDAHANDRAVRLGRVYHTVHMGLGAYVAGIDAQALKTRLQSAHGKTVIKMDVSNEGQGRACANGRQRRNGGFIRHSQTHHLAAPFRQSGYLCQRGFRVTGVCVGHALNHNGRAPAHSHAAEAYGPGAFAHAFSPIKSLATLCRHILLRASCKLFPAASQACSQLCRWNMFCMFFEKNRGRADVCFIQALKFIAQGPISTTERY